jgi:hypothetical protein
MSDKRVRFDFELTFANGGAMQGQGFRLDIEGDDMNDDALAAYIIRDMRLLMVDQVRILGKQVIAETHKRSASKPQTASATHTARRVDLSHTIENGLVTYKGMPAPLICDHLSRVASRAIYDPPASPSQPCHRELKALAASPSARTRGSHNPAHHISTR